MARQLRQAGIGVEVYPEAKKLGTQLAYAEKKGFTIALIAGPDEISKSIWQVKQLSQRTSQEVTTTDLVQTVASILQSTLSPATK